MKKRWFSFLGIALSLTALPLQANEARSDNLKALFKVIFSDMFLQVSADQAISTLSLEIDPALLVKKFREEMANESTFTQLAEPYAFFSDEEIAGLSAMFTSPLYQKFTTQGASAMVANFKTIHTVLLDLAQANGTLKATKEAASSGILEVTEENFASLIEQSEVPLIIDVYASWCGPCKRLSPILEKVSERYPEIRFVKINSDTEHEIASRYQVRSLPTLLFVLPGKKEPAMKSVGQISEQVLEEKIAEFQKLLS